MVDCPICDEELRADEPWRLLPEYDVGEPVTGGEYGHEECVYKERDVMR